MPGNTDSQTERLAGRLSSLPGRLRAAIATHLGEDSPPEASGVSEWASAFARSAPRRKLSLLLSACETLEEMKQDQIVTHARKLNVRGYHNNTVGEQRALIIEQAKLSALCRRLELTCWGYLANHSLATGLAVTVLVAIVPFLVAIYFWWNPRPASDPITKEIAGDVDRLERNIGEIERVVEEELGLQRRLDAQDQTIAGISEMLFDPPPITERARRYASLITEKDALYPRALKAIVEERPDDALKLLDLERKQQDGVLVRNYCATADAYIQKFEPNEALLWWAKAHKLSPRTPRVLENLGFWHATQGNLDSSIEHYTILLDECDRKLISSDTLRDAYVNRAVVFREKGLPESALDDITKALALIDSSDVSNERIRERVNTLVSRGAVHGELEQFDLAFQDFEAALHISRSVTRQKESEQPELSAQVLVSRASVFEASSQIDAALSDFEKAIELSAPLSSTESMEVLAASYNNRGLLYERRGELRKAIADQTKAIEVRENLLSKQSDIRTIGLLAGSYSNRASANLSLGKNEKAWDDLGRAADLYALVVDRGTYGKALNALADVTHNRGFVARGKGDVQGEIQAYSKAIELYEELAEKGYDTRGRAANSLHKRAGAYGRLGEVNKSERDFRAATSAYDDLIANDEHDKWTKAKWSLDIEMGEMLVLNDRPLAAIQALSRALAVRENDTALTWRGVAHKSVGDWESAVSDFQKAIRLLRDAVKSDESLGIRILLATCLGNLAEVRATCDAAQFRDGPSALTMATEACELTSWHDLGCIHALAAAHAECGDFKKAIELQESVVLRTIGEARSDAEARLKLYRERQPFRVTGKQTSHADPK